MIGSQLRRYLTSLAVTRGALAQAQVAEVDGHIPHLYLILAVNSVLLAATHLATAPRALSVGVPACLMAISLARTIAAHRRRASIVDPEQAIRRLRSLTVLAFIIGAAFTAWSLSLLPYGDAYARCHVAFYMAITVNSCIFCLRHAPRAALILTITVGVPFALVIGATREPVLVAIAINLVLVSISLTVAVLKQFADFADLASSREELLHRQDELERLSTENLRLANLDSLTGLPNRRSFFAALEATLQGASERADRFAVALIDLDGFKTVNDIHGHAAGDRLLIEAAQRLMALEGPDLTFARLGGDEFAAICGGSPTDEALRALGELLCRTLRGRYLAPDVAAAVSGSVGIVAFPEGATSAEQLFERADFALYHAKQTCKGTAVLFSAAHELMIRETSLIEHALQQADQAREFHLVFQPIVDVQTGTIHAFEALARWDSPIVGRVHPDIFIRMAERSQSVGRLTEVLFAKALEAAADWSDDIRVAFNLSALDIEAPDRIRALLALVRESRVDPGRIDLEITETAIARDFGTALVSLRLLREAGIRISLDDFGTGYSSLSQLHVLKPHKVKIDRSFIADLGSRAESRDIVRTTVELCRSLGLDSVVEGVETPEQVHLLRGFGCRLMQGYHFARPLDREAACRAAEASARRRFVALVAG